MSTATKVPGVWIGCIGCFNQGHSIGMWFPADDIPETMEDFSTRYQAETTLPHGHILMKHEELWVQDNELDGLLPDECSPSTAARTWEAVQDLDTDDRRAFAAWLSNANGRETVTGELVEQFRDSYCGRWDTEGHYAMQWVEDCGYVDIKCYTHPLRPERSYCERCQLVPVIEFLQRHLDWGSIVQELENDGYWFIDAPGYEDDAIYISSGVYVFSPS